MTKVNRRAFLGAAAASFAAPYVFSDAARADEKIPGFDQTGTKETKEQKWEPYTDKKVRDGKLRFVLQDGIGSVKEFEPGIFAKPVEESLAREIILAMEEDVPEK